MTALTLKVAVEEDTNLNHGQGIGIIDQYQGTFVIDLHPRKGIIQKPTGGVKGQDLGQEIEGGGQDLDQETEGGSQGLDQETRAGDQDLDQEIEGGSQGLDQEIRAGDQETEGGGQDLDQETRAGDQDLDQETEGGGQDLDQETEGGSQDLDQEIRARGQGLKTEGGGQGLQTEGEGQDQGRSSGNPPRIDKGRIQVTCDVPGPDQRNWTEQKIQRKSRCLTQTRLKIRRSDPIAQALQPHPNPHHPIAHQGKKSLNLPARRRRASHPKGR